MDNLYKYPTTCRLAGIDKTQKNALSFELELVSFRERFGFIPTRAPSRASCPRRIHAIYFAREPSSWLKWMSRMRGGYVKFIPLLIDCHSKLICLESRLADQNGSPYNTNQQVADLKRQARDGRRSYSNGKEGKGRRPAALMSAKSANYTGRSKWRRKIT